MGLQIKERAQRVSVVSVALGQGTIDSTIVDSTIVDSTIVDSQHACGLGCGM
jgi:hypothetical protein